MSTREGYTRRARSDEDLEHSSQLSKQLLNNAIVRADISRSFEDYFEILDRFYADEIVLISQAARPAASQCTT